MVGLILEVTRRAAFFQNTDTGKDARKMKMGKRKRRGKLFMPPDGVSTALACVDVLRLLIKEQPLGLNKEAGRCGVLLGTYKAISWIF